LTEIEHGIAREIRRLVRDDLGVAWDGPDDVPLAGSLDSLALLSLVVAVEDRFRVRLGDDDAAGVRSLADLARVVAAKLGATGREASP
jgi:acyl carrier protein